MRGGAISCGSRASTASAGREEHGARERVPRQWRGDRQRCDGGEEEGIHTREARAHARGAGVRLGGVLSAGIAVSSRSDGNYP